MKVYSFTFPVLVLPFSQHSQVKDQVLALIEQTDTDPIKEPVNSITKGNWQQSSHKDAYWQLIADAMHQDINQATRTIGYEATVANQWFQQYLRHDTHSWHTHPGSDLSIIYYVELPAYSATEFLDTASNKVSSFPVQEGDLIIFPSLLTHRSPVNRTPHRKTVIAMNARATNHSAEMRY